MNNELVFYNNKNIFRPSDIALLFTPKSKAIANYSKEECKTLALAAGVNSQYNVFVADTATYLIHQVIRNNCDDDTLVVISYKEHLAVETAAYGCKNLLVLNKDDIKSLNTKKIIQEFNKLKLKKIFVAFIGTCYQDGEWFSDTFFIKLKETIKDIPHKMLLDDCQSMFALNHRYGLFDYIVSTGHVLVKNFDMGILMTTCKDETYGIDAYNWVGEYLQRLDLLVPKIKEYSFDYQTKMKDIFSVLLSSGKAEVINSVPHIFSLKINEKCKFTQEEMEKLDEYNVLVFDYNHDNDFIIRFRLADALQSDNLKESILYCYNLLSRDIPEISYKIKELTHG